jgi:hypothetical protein
MNTFLTHLNYSLEFTIVHKRTLSDSLKMSAQKGEELNGNLTYSSCSSRLAMITN